MAVNRKKREKYKYLHIPEYLKSMVVQYCQLNLCFLVKKFYISIINNNRNNNLRESVVRKREPPTAQITHRLTRKGVKQNNVFVNKFYIDKHRFILFSTIFLFFPTKRAGQCHNIFYCF